MQSSDLFPPGQREQVKQNEQWDKECWSQRAWKFTHDEGVQTRIKVKEPHQVAVGRTSVVVFDERDLAHILPLLTMTGITYLKTGAKNESRDWNN